MNIQINANLKKYTTFKIGGNAKYFIEVKSVEDLIEAFQFAKKNNLKFFILAKGSNILFDDRGFNGLVIFNKIEFIHFFENIVEVSSGLNIAKLANECMKKKLSGFEFAAPLPGSVGGAVFMNASANNQSTFDNLISVCYLDENLNKIIIEKKDIQFGYRYTFFHEMKGFILSAKFKLSFKEGILNHQRELIKKRSETQPINTNNAGSIFKNPKDNFAAKLIEECNLKGFKIGGACVSIKHANFIVNEKNATFKDVINLIKHIKKQVYDKKNITLQEEIKIINYE
jgi:UDP-N-acetylmuramate dehydrogenase